MTETRTRSVFGWLSAVWLAFLLALSFLPAHWKILIHTKGRLHDSAHLFVFGTFAFLLARTARTREGQIVRLFWAAVLGLAVEVFQDLKFSLPQGSWSPVEWTDVLMDTMAVVLVGIVELGIVPVLERSRRLDGRDRAVFQR